MKYRINRRDTGSKALEQYAVSIGLGIAHNGGAWDCDVFIGARSHPVDWKAPGAELTKTQQRLLAAGFPLRFIHKPEQLDALKQELMRAA